MRERHPFKWRHFQSDIILLCVRWLCWLLGTSVLAFDVLRLIEREASELRREYDNKVASEIYFW